MPDSFVPVPHIEIPSDSVLRDFSPQYFDQLYAALIATEELIEFELDRRSWQPRPPALSLKNDALQKQLVLQLDQVKAEAFRMHRIFVTKPWSRWWRVQRGRLHSTLNCRSIDRRIDDDRFHWTLLSLAVEFSGLSREEVLATPPEAPDSRPVQVCKICGGTPPDTPC